MKTTRKTNTGVLFLMALIGVLFLLFTSSGTLAETKYPSKNIKFIVQSKVGGGFDVFCRSLGRFLVKYLPRKTNILYENLAGGGGAQAYAKIFVSKPDGHTIGVINIPGAAVAPMIMPVKYELSKFTYLVRGSRSIHGLFVNPKTPYKTLKDIQKAERVKFAGAGHASTGYLMTLVAANEIGFHLGGGLVQYKSGKEARVAIIRGDAEALFMDMDNFYSQFKAGNVRVIFPLNEERHPLYPDLPSVSELGYPQLAELCNNKVIVGPPDMPPDITQILRDALWKAVNDPEFIVWGKKSRQVVRKQLRGADARKLALDWEKRVAKYKHLYPKQK